MREDYHVKNEAGDGRQSYCKACRSYRAREQHAERKPVLVPTVEQKLCRCELDMKCRATIRATTRVIGISASKRWLCPLNVHGQHRLRERGPGCTAEVSPCGLYSGSLNKSCPRQRSRLRANPAKCA